MRYLGLDLGSKTLGISISDKMGILAKAYNCLRFDTDNYASLIPMLKGIVDKESIDTVILGYPKNMNNTIGARAIITEEFKDLIEKKLNVDVILTDERLSTVEAESVLIDANMSRVKRKEVIDKLAAVIILQNYLNMKGTN